MKKKMVCILQCLMIVAVLSGCWSRKEPKNLSMVNSVLYDLNEEGKSQIVIEIMNPSAQTGGGETSGPQVSGLTLLCEGDTMPEAARAETKSIDKVLFAGLNQVRLFSEKLAQKGIAPLLDFFSRDHLTDETPLMVVVQDQDPKRIYTCKTGLSDMVGNYFNSLSNTQHKSTCESVFVTTLEFMKDYYEDGKQPVMGLAQIVENEAKSLIPAQAGAQKSQSNSQDNKNAAEKELYIKYEGLAAFRDDKLVGYMDGTEARVYNMITNDFTTSLVSLPSGNDDIVAAVQKTKSDIKTNIQNEQASIDVKIKAELSIIQAGNPVVDVSNSETLKMIKQGFNKKLETQITQSIEKAQQEFQSDIFGFGCFAHTQHPKEWKTIKGKWDDLFAKAKVNVTVESSIIREGEIKYPFVMEEQNDK